MSDEQTTMTTAEILEQIHPAAAISLLKIDVVRYRRALEIIAGGDGDAQVIARQTLEAVDAGTPETTEQGRLAYPYDDDCHCPDGPPGSEPGWWCPFGHESYRDDCWGCRY